jgi:hypothetical protein
MSSDEKNSLAFDFDSMRYFLMSRKSNSYERI